MANTNDRSALDKPAGSPEREAGHARGSGRPREDDQADDGRWADRGVVPRPEAGTRWVVVADEAVARFLVSDPDAPGELLPVHAFTDPEAHVKEGEQKVNDGGRRSGRVSSEGGNAGHSRNFGGGASVVASAGVEDRHLEAQAFARRVAAHLAEAHRQKQFDSLVLVAAPRFLGLLRKELDAKVSAVVEHELNKDVIHESEAQVAARLRELPQP